MCLKTSESKTYVTADMSINRQSLNPIHYMDSFSLQAFPRIGSKYKAIVTRETVNTRRPSADILCGRPMV